jgi:Zn-dependent protease with chaperone function
MSSLRLAASLPAKVIARSHLSSLSSGRYAATTLWRTPPPRLLVSALLPATPWTRSLRQFATHAVKLAAKQQEQQGKQEQSSRYRWLHRLATLARYVRIPFLVFGVYQIGYQQGIMECTKTPQMLQDKLLQSILMSSGVTDMRHVTVLGDWEMNRRRFGSGHEHHHVAAVGQKIIQAARDHVQAELRESIAKVRAQLPDDMAESIIEEHYKKDEACIFWYDAALRLMGESDRPWQYIFIQTSLPNAFVSEILPQRFFITTGLLELAETADELGFVLGHEVSHLILGHVSSANQVEMFLKTLEVLLLSIDPTAGVLSLFVIGGLAAARRAVMAANSREHEREADDLGVEIAARACFDTIKGAEVMKKMYHLSTLERPLSSISTGSKVAHLYDSHPPSEERYDTIVAKAQEVNPDRYDECATVSQRLFSFVWGPTPREKSHTADGEAAMDKMEHAQQ